jgi:hypothetical protein
MRSLSSTQRSQRLKRIYKRIILIILIQFKNQNYITLNIKAPDIRFNNNKKNSKMEVLHDILLITIPSLMVFLASFLAMRNMISNDQDKRRQELILQNSRTITPIKLQAYERIVLFLERISLESLIVRTNSQGMSAAQLHTALLNNIRSEFEHNLSQQIYMSQQAWEVVKNARSNTIKIINTEFEKAAENTTSLELSRKLLERLMEIEKEPTKAAIEYIKNEVARMI